VERVKQLEDLGIVTRDACTLACRIPALAAIDTSLTSNAKKVIDKLNTIDPEINFTRTFAKYPYVLSIPYKLVCIYSLTHSHTHLLLGFGDD